MLHTGHRHLSTRARVDGWLHHTDERRRLAGLLAAPLLALLLFSVLVSPAAAKCQAGQNSTETTFICDDADAVVFTVSGGLLKHNRKTAGDPDFNDDFDF